MFYVLLFLIQLVFFVSADLECSSATEYDFGYFLATKTPYRIIKNHDEKKLQYHDCIPIRIWSIIRHGSRNPSRKLIKLVKTRLVDIRDKIINDTGSPKLCEEEIEDFKNWKFHLDESQQKMLVYEGVDELIELAERMQNRLPNLFPDIYDPSWYKFKYTATERTKRSAESFATGLFGRNNLKYIEYPEAVHKDPVLRFYKLCEKWKAEVDKNPDALSEVKKFTKSDQMRNVVEKLRKKTGIDTLSSSDIHLMYTICAFETAWNKRETSPWCLLFDNDSLLTLEFLEDLEYYWIDGYGYEITTKQACPAFSDMINHIDPTSIEPNATLYFTHSGTMLKFLGHLGLYKDDFILTHKEFKRNRKWRVSKIDAFASNLSFITFKCATGTKILTMHQEKIVHLPGCPIDTDLCDLDIIKRNYEESWGNCQFEELCKIR